MSSSALFGAGKYNVFGAGDVSQAYRRLAVGLFPLECMRATNPRDRTTRSSVKGTFLNTELNQHGLASLVIRPMHAMVGSLGVPAGEPSCCGSCDSVWAACSACGLPAPGRRSTGQSTRRPNAVVSTVRATCGPFIVQSKFPMPALQLSSR